MLRENDALFRQKDNSAPKPPSRWVEVKEAYGSAGIHLLKTAEDSKSRKDADVYPALFLCRHAIELELKAALGIAYAATMMDLQCKLTKIFRTHDLARLWKMPWSTPSTTKCSPQMTIQSLDGEANDQGLGH